MTRGGCWDDKRVGGVLNDFMAPAARALKYGWVFLDHALTGEATTCRPSGSYTAKLRLKVAGGFFVID